MLSPTHQARYADWDDEYDDEEEVHNGKER